MKAYTDIEQSKKLAEILPITSIDFAWNIFSDGSARLLRMDDWEVSENAKSDVEIIPCWSLAALLSILPEIQGSKPMIYLNDNYVTYTHMSIHTKADNLVDACVEMILKLHELKML